MSIFDANKQHHVIGNVCGIIVSENVATAVDENLTTKVIVSRSPGSIVTSKFQWTQSLFGIDDLGRHCHNIITSLLQKLMSKYGFAFRCQKQQHFNSRGSSRTFTIDPSKKSVHNPS